MTSTETLKIEVAIAGGGIIGLWCAYSILKKFPTLTVAVFESEDYLGEHSTGRNSEVLHAGLYYATDSLKHIHCIEGNRLWRDYISRKSMSFLDCGKIIAANRNQGDALEKLWDKGIKNGVPGLRRLTKTEVDSLTESLFIDDGLASPSSGVLNVAESLGFLKQDIQTMGGIVLTGSEARIVGHSNGKFSLDINGDLVESTVLINAAGLTAVEFRKKLGLQGYENFYVKGSYLRLAKKLPVDKLIYPLPPSDGLGLGVHITLDTAGEQKFGPDTEVVEKIDYAVSENLIQKMAPAIHQVFKNVADHNLRPGYAGVRPKVKKDGVLVTDFVLNTSREHQIEGYFEFLGIESPGVTAAPSLAQKLVQLL